MRKLLLFGLAALSVAILIFVSCLRDPDVEPSGGKDTRSHGRLTREEAQSEFERHFAEQVKTRSGSDSEGDLLVDFDYTPLWYDGKLEHNDYSSLMTVPILTDRVMYVGYYGDGGEKPTRVARVTQEVHVVKNFELGITMPTIKTVIPLDGVIFRPNMRALEIHDYYSNRSEVTFYQTLDGRIITAKLIENGIVTVIAFIGEDAEAYREKISLIYSKVHGYGYKIGKKRIATRGGIESDNDSNVPGSGQVSCIVCQGKFNSWDIDYHDRICIWCQEKYKCGYDHECPYCFTCKTYTCKIPSHRKMEGIFVTPHPCKNCPQIYESAKERSDHSCFCNNCQGYYFFHDEFYPHKCSTVTNPPVICANCGNNPCTCLYGGGGGSGSGSTTPSKPGDDNKKKNKNFPDKKPKEPKDDCGDSIFSEKQKAISIFDIFEDLEAKGYQESSVKHEFPSFQDFVDAMKSEPGIEHSFTMDSIKYFDQGYIGHGAIIHGETNRVQVNTGHFSCADIHNHPNNTPPSPLDVWRVVDIAANSSSFPKYQSSYIYNQNGECYCVHVTDRQKASQFMANYPNLGSVIDTVTNEFAKESNFYNDFRDAQKEFSKLGKNDAWCHALSYVAEMHDMGVVIMKREKGAEKFETKHVIKDENGKYVPARCK